MRTWYDEKFKPAGQAAFQLTKFTKVYYDDDGIFTCPVRNKLYTVKGNSVNLQKVIANIYYGKEPGDTRQPTVYITNINDIKQLVRPREANLMSRVM